MQLFHRLIDLRHRQHFRLWCNAVTGGEIEHLLRRDRAPERGSSDRFVSRDEWEHRRTDTRRGPDEVELSFRPQGRDILVPVELDIHGDEEKIETVRRLVERIRVFGVDEMMSPETAGMFLLIRTRREGGDLAAPLIEKLQRHVTEATDPDDTNAIRWGYLIRDDGVEDGDPSAEERSDCRRIKPFR